MLFTGFVLLSETVAFFGNVKSPGATMKNVNPNLFEVAVREVAYVMGPVISKLLYFTGISVLVIIVILFLALRNGKEKTIWFKVFGYLYLITISFVLISLGVRLA